MWSWRAEGLLAEFGRTQRASSLEDKIGPGLRRTAKSGTSGDGRRSSTWRIGYRVDSDEIVVVDVFAKKTQATPKQAIVRCKQRLRDWDRDD